VEYVILAAVVVGAAIAISAYVTSRRRVWVIHIRAGVPFLTRGKIAQTVVAEMADVLQRHGVRRGALYGLNSGRMVRLGFSRQIPAGARQALRNVWSMHAR
jgi:Protein of unknown function (DUF3634)